MEIYLPATLLWGVFRLVELDTGFHEIPQLWATKENGVILISFETLILS